MAPHEIPPPPARFDEDGEWLVRQFVTPDELARSPEEYVARHSHAIGSFSFQFFRYADRELAAWVGRVGELLTSETEVERCRALYLTPPEVFAAKQSETDGL